MTSSSASVGWFLRRLYPYYREQLGPWLIAFVALASVHVVEIAIPACLRRGVDLVAAGDTRIVRPVLAIVALAVLRFGLLRLGRRQNALVSIEVSCSLRRALHAHLQTLGRGFYARYSLGDLMARSSHDLQTIWRFFRSALYQLVSVVAVVVVAPIFMARESLLLTALVVPLLALNFAVAFQLAQRIRVTAARVQGSFGQLTALIEQSLKGIRTIQLHGQEGRELERVGVASSEYAALQQRAARLNAALRSSTLLSSALVTLAVLGFGGHQVMLGQLSVGTLTGFITYLGMVMAVLNNASWPVFAYLNAATAATRVFQLFDEQAEIRDDAHASGLAARCQGELRAHDLSFHYARAGGPTPAVLDGVSLTVRAGELVTILGKVGAGKTTLLRLLSRQLEPSAGQLTLDGRPFRSIALTDLRRAIAVVPQDAFLFTTSLSENISYDDPERPVPIILQAACAAQLETTIAALADGLATRVGERGLTLSGGQRQRTSIARGLIRDTPILLLDDCFSALDADTEALLIAELRLQRRGLTTVVVSHRVSAARHADRIYVLDEGRIVETGAHAELLQRAGHYARLTLQHPTADADQTTPELEA